ncbi:MAG: hypothetical protein JTT11_06670 [Candidatus Brockarchaeota archaeon]|nr:hypothetical protein [Candidatus Brockarchaeota archaeon]
MHWLALGDQRSRVKIQDIVPFRLHEGLCLFIIEASFPEGVLYVLFWNKFDFALFISANILKCLSVLAFSASLKLRLPPIDGSDATSVPVARVGIGNAKNAALLAVEITSVRDKELWKLSEFGKRSKAQPSSGLYLRRAYCQPSTLIALFLPSAILIRPIP